MFIVLGKLYSPDLFLSSSPQIGGLYVSIGFVIPLPSRSYISLGGGFKGNKGDRSKARESLRASNFFFAQRNKEESVSCERGSKVEIEC